MATLEVDGTGMTMAAMIIRIADEITSIDVDSRANTAPAARIRAAKARNAALFVIKKGAGHLIIQKMNAESA